MNTTRKESCRDVVHGMILFSSLPPQPGSALRRLLRRNTNRVKFKALHITRSNNNNPQVPTHPRLPFSFPPHVKPRAAATVPPDPIAVVVSSKLSPPVVFRSAISAQAATYDPEDPSGCWNLSTLNLMSSLTTGLIIPYRALGCWTRSIFPSCQTRSVDLCPFLLIPLYKPSNRPLH